MFAAIPSRVANTFASQVPRSLSPRFQARMMAAKAPVVVIHGGAGARARGSDATRRKQVMTAAVKAAAAALRQGASAAQAAASAVVALEDDPLFNAGYGSVLTFDGAVEADASLMVGGDQPRAGGVGAVRGVKNPVLLAQAVMERTSHVLIVGDGARRLAREAGLTCCRPQELIATRARLQWEALHTRRLGTSSRLAPRHNLSARPDAARGSRGMDGSRARAAAAKAAKIKPGETVGAVGLDLHGGFAAATSTGGIAGKLAGRVGDSAIVGAGTFADARGAASATGAGEAILKAGLCRLAVQLLRTLSPEQAVSRAIAELACTTQAHGGIILLDGRGRYAFAHNAQAMDVACFDPANGARFFSVRPMHP